MKLTITFMAVVVAVTVASASRILPPYVVIARPIANGQMELTVYLNNQPLKKREIKVTSEAQLQEIAAGIITHEFLPRVSLNITGGAYVTRAGWVDGNYVMVVGFRGRLGGGFH
jgi:hypothetical protein